MSYILALTAIGMLVHLLKTRHPVRAKRWLVFFYLGLAGWQVENVVRYSTLLDHFATPLYSVQTIFFYIHATTFFLLTSSLVSLVKQFKFIYLEHRWN